MPLFATMVAGLGSAFVSLFSKFMGIQAALKLASYAAYLSIIAVFTASVYVCIGGLLTYVSGFQPSGGGGGGWVQYFMMGLGMFIPSNAGGVLSCIGSVWLACNVYRLQHVGVIQFSR